MLEIREARPEEWYEVGALTQAAWDEFAPAAPNETWYAYYAFLLHYPPGAERCPALSETRV